MTKENLFKGLASIAPTAFCTWLTSSDETPELPYIIYFPGETDYIGADNTSYAELGTGYTVELYSERKTEEKEKAIESFFDSNQIFYDKAEAYISSEKLYMCRYSVNF